MQPKRYTFFLSSFKGEAFTRCPQCQEKTKVRKFPFLVMLKPQGQLFLNMTSKFCPDCDLIILRQDALEIQLEHFFREVNPEIIGNDYLVMGTMERADWLKAKRGQIPQEAVMEKVFFFSDYVQFDVAQAGWYLDKKQ